MSLPKSASDSESVLNWREFTLPGSNLPIQLARLRRGSDGRIAVACRFPPGWSRPVVVHYDGYEEFVVLEGDLSVDGVTYGPGDYAFIPERMTRTATSSVGGCLTIALFTGSPEQLPGESNEPPADTPVHKSVGTSHGTR